MADPFRTLSIRGWLIAGAMLVLASALIVAVAFLNFGLPITKGHEVHAQVMRVGARPTGGVAGGDLPILTVRLPNGAVRDVQATWADINGCKKGSSISLLQQGSALQIGRPGCVAAS